MVIVGLTGGIGSGKTTVLNYFKELGVSCYIADVEAKKLMQTSSIIKKAIIDKFGEESYVDNKLNRKYLAQIVFQNPDKLTLLNAIVHPVVQKDFERFARKAIGDYIIYESAILLNSKTKEFCDFIIVVSAPLKIRIERVMLRDKSSKKEILDRINQQLSESKMLAQADFTLHNNTFKATKKEVLELHQKILQRIKNSN